MSSGVASRTASLLLTFRALSAMCSVQMQHPASVCNVQCVVCSVQCVTCRMQCAVCTEPWAECSVACAVCMQECSV